jgi:hypothetical protein
MHKKTRLQPAPVARDIPHEAVIPIIDADIRFRFRDPKAPPSPNSLAYRLSALSPRHPSASPLSNSFPEPAPEEDFPGATDDDTESPSEMLDVESPLEWGRHPQRNQKERAASSAATTSTANQQGTTNQDDDSRALDDAVRGLFWLWKTRRGSNSSPGGRGDISAEEIDQTDFLRLVGRAIATKK